MTEIIKLLDLGPCVARIAYRKSQHLPSGEKNKKLIISGQYSLQIFQEADITENFPGVPPQEIYLVGLEHLEALRDGIAYLIEESLNK